MNSAIVVGFNQKFESLAFSLIKSLLLFSKFDIIIVGYNYKPNFSNDRIKTIKLENIDEKYIPYISKMDACLAAIDNTDYKNFIWIDTDAISTKYIDNIDKYFDRIKNYPLISSHLHDYFLMTDHHHPNGVIPLEFLMNYFKEKFIPHKPWLHACLFIFNKECKWFFEETKRLYELLKHFNYFWIHDELFFNYIFSKMGFTDFLEVKVLNIFKPEVFDLYLKIGKPTIEIYDLSEAVQEYKISTIIPKTNEDLYIFHGIRDVNFSRNVLEKYINSIIKI